MKPRATDILLAQIRNKVVSLRQGLSSSDRLLLNDNRFLVAWCDHESLDHRINRRWGQARSRYRKLLITDAHLFCAFILTVAVTECCSPPANDAIDQLSLLDKGNPTFTLSDIDKSLLERAAREGGFAESNHFKHFMKHIWPPESSLASNEAQQPPGHRHAEATIVSSNAAHPTMELMSPLMYRTKQVFKDARISAAIGCIPANNGDKNSEMAMLMMELPRKASVLVDGKMTIGVKADAVGAIAFHLLGYTVGQEGNHRVLISSNGIQFVMPEDIPFKHIKLEAILDVFGEELHRSICECVSRAEEVEQGQELTDCVIMNISHNPYKGATITVSHSFRGGLQIADKLYNENNC